jgi:DNA topoisomerase-1
VAELIEDKLQKNIDKVIHNWEEEGILVQKARWGKSEITKGKIKIELNKDIDASKLTLEEVKEMIAKKTPEKKTAAKKPAAKKTTTKKAPAKKK